MSWVRVPPEAADFSPKKSSSGVVELCCVALYIGSKFVKYVYHNHSHGHQERSFRMEYVSNSPFSEAEFSKWKKEVYTCTHIMYIQYMYRLGIQVSLTLKIFNFLVS